MEPLSSSVVSSYQVCSSYDELPSPTILGSTRPHAYLIVSMCPLSDLYRHYLPPPLLWPSLSLGIPTALLIELLLACSDEGAWLICLPASDLFHPAYGLQFIDLGINDNMSSFITTFTQAPAGHQGHFLVD